MEKIISYIVKFLIGGEKAGTFGSLVGYTDDESKFSRYKVVILPSPFFKENVYGEAESIPKLPLNTIQGVPLLFGTPQVEWFRETLVVHADIIAASYFLLTRYEELCKRNERDAYGRFAGKSSLPYRAGFIHRPVVDEYGKLLREWLRHAHVDVAEPKPEISKIWLTHDVDAPFYCRTLRNFARVSIKGEGWRHALNYLTGPLEQDPYYTFPWLLKLSNSLKNTIGNERSETVFFFKSSGSSPEDKPKYNLYSRDMRKLLALCASENVTVGLHSSFDAGKTPSLITSELELLEKATGRTIRYNRHHYLASREPEDMDWLERTGITDDFTMGYADVAGFRLGTCHPVHWINPENKRISSLLLHPLTIMECSLSERQYMNLAYNEAFAYCRQLAEQVAQAGGELVLLWHNDSIAKNEAPGISTNWQRKLLASLIRNIF
ncbi:MAG: polysaccharide deacetylase family protein [Tannerellaceae bacterium]|jgi:hypothetical protein|nr:polysaccharide deacetylase family protein [Tannerellaceae bacterium]